MSLVKIMFQHLVYSYILLPLFYFYNKWVKSDMKLCCLYILGELGIRHLVVILKDKSRRAVPPSLCCELVLFFVCLILEMNWFCGLPNRVRLSSSIFLTGGVLLF